MGTTTNTAKIIIDTNQAQNSLARLHGGLDKTSKMFGGLKTALATIGFAALGRSAIQAASELKDLSDATGFTVDKLASLKVALNSVGGQSDKLPQLITTFAKSLDEAAQGSLKAQNAFREVGVSISDLQSLSNEDLFQKTLLGLGQVKESSRKVALSLDLMGKSAMTLSAGDLANALKETAAQGDKYADSIRKAAELNDKFGKAADNLKLAFIEAFAPIIDKINEMAEKTEEGTSQLDKMVTGLKLVGVAIATSFGVTAAYGFVKIVGVIGRGVTAIAGSLGGVAGASAIAAKSPLFRAGGPAMTALRAILITIGSIGGAVTATSILFPTLGDKIENMGTIASLVLSRIVEGIGEVAASALNLPTDLIAGIMNMFGAGIKDPIGLGTPIQMLVDKAKASRLEFEATLAAQKKAKEEGAKAAGPAATPITGSRPVDLTEYNKAINAAKQIGAEYVVANEKVKDHITLQTLLIGKSEQESEIINMRNDLYARERDQIDQLTKAKENLSAEEKKSGVAAEYDRQIALVKALTAEEEKTLEVLVKQKQEKTRMNELTMFGLQQQISTADQLRKITSDTAQLTMGTLAKAYKEIEDSAENTYQSELAKAKLNNTALSSSDMEAIKKAAYSGVEAQKAASAEYYKTSRSFSTGWQSAFNDYVENATNAAEQARNIFQTATKGMEDMIVNFAKTGKFEFKDFLSSIVEMMLRADIQKTMASMFNFSAPSGGGGGGNIFSSIGKMLGFANGGTIPTNGPVIVGERGPEILTGAAGRSVIPNNQLGGGSTQVTYNINAVDARSFQQLLASDPEFLYAVSLKGQRSLPGGR